MVVAGFVFTGSERATLGRLRPQDIEEAGRTEHRIYFFGSISICEAE
jgi:hypothetical protein